MGIILKAGVNDFVFIRFLSQMSMGHLCYVCACVCFFWAGEECVSHAAYSCGPDEGGHLLPLFIFLLPPSFTRSLRPTNYLQLGRP